MPITTIPATFWSTYCDDVDEPPGSATATWRRWPAALRSWGVRHVVLQHVSLGGVDVLVPGQPRCGVGPVDTLREVLDALHAQGIRVTLGLDGVVSAHWTRIDPAVPRNGVIGYLATRAARHQALASALQPLTAHPACAGWYIPDEIDDLSWAHPERAALLGDWLRQVTGSLRALAPQLPIAIAGFANARRIEPTALAEQWRNWLAAAPALDEVIVMDSVGSGYIPEARALAYLSAVAEVVRAAGRRFTVDVELFDPDPANPHTTVPADAQRVRRQIAAAETLGPDWIAYAVPHHLLGDSPRHQALRAGLGGPP
jgi:hypothetical protein